MNSEILREHQIMSAKIKKLPDANFDLWTSQQKEWLIHRKKYWTTIGYLFDFYQAKMLGNKPHFAKWFEDTHDLQKEQFMIKSAWHFSQLQLIIEGFDTIRIFAYKEKRSFPFKTPRELFAKTIQEIANFEFIQTAGSPKIKSGMSLTKIRESFSHELMFWEKKLSTEKHNDYLHYLKQSHLWSDYWMYPIWRYKYDDKTQSKMKEDADFQVAFHAHLVRLKSYRNFLLTPPKSKDAYIVSLKWSAGHPYEPKTGHVPILALNTPLVLLNIT